MQVCAIACAVFSVTQCTNYGLYEKMADPESVLPETLTAFVLSMSTNGDMSLYTGGPLSQCNGYTGIFRADCACQTAATNNNLPMPKSGTYVAWMSLVAAPFAWDMTCRIQGRPGTACAAPKKDARWKDTVGETIASSYSRLFSGVLEKPVNRTESGSVFAGNKAWTGTQPNGLVVGSGASAATCDDWMDGSSMTAYTGDPAQTNAFWTQDTSSLCSTSSNSVYCFAQMVP